MHLGLMSDAWSGTLDDMIDEVAFAANSKMDTYWLAQVWRFDAMTLIPHLAATAPALQFATGVVASWLRHPMTLASQALTTSLLTQGRFTLGVGLMHKPIIEGMFEIPFDHPVRHMGEYLDVLLPLLADRQADARGDSVSYHGPMDVPGANDCPVVLAALGPQMLRLAGARTTGTITWMTGPATIRNHVGPTIAAAAEAAGRSAPRIVALVPVHVTDNIASATTQADEKLALYGQMPSYRAMLDREGYAAPSDAAVIGNEQFVRDRLGEYEESGVTDLGLQILAGPDDRERTRELIASL